MIKDNLFPAVVLAASLLAWPGLIAPLNDTQRHQGGEPALEANGRESAWEGLGKLLPGLPGAFPLRLYRPR